MLEKPSKKEEQKKVEAQEGLAESSKEAEKEDYGIYLPTVEEASDHFLARQLIEWARNANERLDKETALVKKKLEVTNQLVNYWKTEKEEPKEKNEDLEKIKELLGQLKISVDLYQSENPFLALLKVLEEKKIEISNQDNIDFLSKNKKAFSWSSSIKNIFSSKKAEENKKYLIDRAKEIIKKSFFNVIFYEVGEIIRKNKEQLYEKLSSIRNIGVIVDKSYSDFSEDSFSVVAKKLNAEKLQFEIFKKFFEDLQKELSENKLAGDINFGWSSFNEEIKKLEDAKPKINWDKELIISTGSLEKRIYHTRDRLEGFIRSLKGEYCEIIKASWISLSDDVTKNSVTKDFIIKMEKLQRKTSDSEKIISRENKVIFWNEACTNAVIKEAMDISSGRILTHSGPTSIMYEMLKTGYLASVDFLRKKLGKDISVKDRTHAMSFGTASSQEEETHDITFDIDQIYKNFTSSEEEIRNIDALMETKLREVANIAIVFSENHLLSQGNLYFQMDGMHMLDKDFKNERVSKGIGINLREEPNMIVVVTEKEKEKFLDFLKDESFLKEDFNKMSGEEFSNWIENNVIFVKNLDDLKDKEKQEIKEIKKEFFRKKDVKLKKGYVVIRKNIKASSKQNLGGPTKQFIPRD